jgi:hypothetical protein
MLLSQFWWLRILLWKLDFALVDAPFSWSDGSVKLRLP